ncbi:MAG: class I SAM-dependent DNA methyltransferase [Bacteroidia bacterium]|nr:class I SAM-dependent DNA methyltransferase [Bacteroidia bacterium]
MPLSWNEIRSRAIKFSKEWEDESNEDAEAKSFLDGFFNVFGIDRRRFASFEKNVKKLDGKDGYIDLIWKGKILIEQKSKGKNLDKAYKQAIDYFPGLKDEELPRCILVCDFERFRLYDLEEDTETEFTLKDFHKNVKHFGFLIGMQLRKFAEQDPVNIKAAEKMGKLHDSLKTIGYEGHALEVYLVRLVFCLFADDTGIFERDIFHDYIKARTKQDGSDLAAILSQLFSVLNTEEKNRLKNLDEDLTHFPYVNGKLFEETLPHASFDSAMRNALLECWAVDWSKISPAIFGSLFQSVMNPEERRNLGAHYTSEKNILKLIKPLFLDELWQRFEKIKSKQKELVKFHDEISLLRFLDPACGCGNFLIIAYRELRLLELEILKQLFPQGQQIIKHDLDVFVKINVDRFYGIEYEEFPAQIAQVAMWLMDHQMNTLVSLTFGENYIRLPLRRSATIANGNALRMDWQTLIDPIPFEKKESVYDFIFGNPPFVGSKMISKEQKEDMDLIFAGVNGAGVLDYVTCWYIKAAQYINAQATEQSHAERSRSITNHTSTPLSVTHGSVPPLSCPEIGLH